MPPKRPPFFYGWVIVGVSFLTVFFSNGVRFIFSVFYVPMLQDLGWLRGGGAGPYALSMLVFPLSLPLMGLLIDRYGPRRIVSLMVVVMGLGIAGCSLVRELWHFFLLFGVVIGMGLAATSVPMQSALVSRWFMRRRGLAIGVAASGGGLGVLLLSPITQHLIDSCGWRGAFLLLASGYLAVLLPLVSLFHRRGPQELGLEPYGRSPKEGPQLKEGATPRVRPSLSFGPRWTLRAALRTHSFWWVFLVAVFQSYAVNLMYAHTVIYLVDAGLSRMRAAGAWGGVGVTLTVSLFLWGAVSDRVGRERAYAAGTACLLLALLLLFGLKREPSLGLFYAFIALAGLGLGSRPGLLNAMVADLFSGEHIAAINGAALSGIAVGGSMGAWSGGYIFDLTGSYDLALLIAATTSGLASLFAFLALPRRLRPKARGAVRAEGP